MCVCVWGGGGGVAGGVLGGGGGGGGVVAHAGCYLRLCLSLADRVIQR